MSTDGKSKLLLRLQRCERLLSDLNGGDRSGNVSQNSKVDDPYLSSAEKQSTSTHNGGGLQPPEPITRKRKTPEKEAQASPTIPRKKAAAPPTAQSREDKASTGKPKKRTNGSPTVPENKAKAPPAVARKKAAAPSTVKEPKASPTAPRTKAKNAPTRQRKEAEAPPTVPIKKATAPPTGKRKKDQAPPTVPGKKDDESRTVPGNKAAPTVQSKPAKASPAKNTIHDSIFERWTEACKAARSNNKMRALCLVGPGGVIVQPSTIPNSGNGLFADRDFKRLSYITLYDGQVTTDRDTLKRSSHETDYILSLGYGSTSEVVRGLRVPQTGRGGGSFANHASDARARNARLSCVYVKSCATTISVVVATKDISRGSEIFVSYGRRYFIDKKHVQEFRVPSSPTPPATPSRKAAVSKATDPDPNLPSHKNDKPQHTSIPIPDPYRSPAQTATMPTKSSKRMRPARSANQKDPTNKTRGHSDSKNDSAGKRPKPSSGKTAHTDPKDEPWVYQAPSRHGYGLFAGRYIPAGTFVGNYGDVTYPPAEWEVVDRKIYYSGTETAEEKLRKDRELQAQINRRRYILAFEYKDGNTYYIDPTDPETGLPTQAHPLAFANEPNGTTNKQRMDRANVQFVRIDRVHRTDVFHDAILPTHKSGPYKVFFTFEAIHNIAKDEEILVWYGDDYDRSHYTD